MAVPVWKETREMARQAQATQVLEVRQTIHQSITSIAMPCPSTHPSINTSRHVASRPCLSPLPTRCLLLSCLVSPLQARARTTAWEEGHRVLGHTSKSAISRPREILSIARDEPDSSEDHKGDEVLSGGPVLLAGSKPFTSHTWKTRKHVDEVQTNTDDYRDGGRSLVRSPDLSWAREDRPSPSPDPFVSCPVLSVHRCSVCCCASRSVCCPCATPTCCPTRPHS